MRTHCPYCALGCAMRLTKTAAGYRAAGDPDFDVNRGELCVKGWTSAETLAHPDRITAPLVRDGGRLREATWDEALERAAQGFRTVAARYGRDAVATFGSGALTNEKVYTLGKFARLVLGTRNFDYNGRFCMSSAAAAGNRAFGVDRGLPFPLDWLARTGCLLVAGGNPLDTMPPLGRYLDEQRTHGTSIVIDPRKTELAQRATLHLQPAPGTDVLLAYGLVHVLLAERREDFAYIEERTHGFEGVRRVALRATPALVERGTGVPADDVVRAARLLSDAPSALVLTARGVEQHANGVDGAGAYINLALALGLPGREYSGFGTLTGQGNGQGGREHGQKSDQLPGYRLTSDPAARAHLAALWGVEPDSLERSGASAYELLDKLGDEIHAIFVVGSNPLVSAPNAHSVAARFARTEHVVVSDFFLSETAQRANVVLPALQWAEEVGTMTNLEGRVLLRERCADPPAGPRSDLTILRDLAARLGCSAAIPSDDPEVVFDEFRRATAGGRADYQGVTYARLRAGERLQWPCTAPDHPGTQRLFERSFPTADGRASFHAVEPVSTNERPDRDYPWYFTTGRVREHYLSGTQTRRVAALAQAVAEPSLSLHSQLAATLGIVEGEKLRVTSRRAAIELPAHINDALRPDTTFAAFHWGGAQCVNALVDDALDPISRMPAFKACAVRIERVASSPNA